MNKQIEEMLDVMVQCEHCSRYNYYTCSGCVHRDETRAYAKLLYNAGYQNCKDKVVLTKKEYEDLCVAKDFDYGYHEGEKNMEAYYTNIELPKIRKETARDILCDVYKLLVNIRKQDCEDSVPYYCEEVEVFDDKLYELAKQYGVEVEQ